MAEESAPQQFPVPQVQPQIQPELNTNTPAPLTDNQKEYLRSQGVNVDPIGSAQVKRAAVDEASRKGFNPFTLKQTPFPSSKLGFPQLYRKHAYERLGFDPTINNFKKYELQTTAWEKIQDSWQSHWTHHWNNFSFFGIGGQDNSSYAAAKRYEQISALGSPIGESGTFDWAMTQFAQAGYTTSIISSVIAEEIALAFATVATGGAASVPAALKSGQNINRLRKAFQGGGRATQQGTRVKGFAAQMIDELQDVNKARSYWQTARQTGAKIVDKSTDILTPHVKDFTKRATSKVEPMSAQAMITDGFGSFWREIREFKLAYEESELEYSFARNSAMEKLVDAYKAKHGKMPEGKDLERLQELAEEAGYSTKLNNIGLIYGANKISFGGLFNRYAPKIGDDIVRTSVGKLHKYGAKLKGGKRASADFVRDGFMNNLKYNLKNWKRAPQNLLAYGLRGTRTGIGEGLEEFGQEIIQEAETTYAVDRYTMARNGSKWDNYTKSFNKFMSPEGGEIFLSGFAMGMFAGPHKFVTSKISDVAHIGAEMTAGNYKENQQKKLELQEKFEKDVEKINEMFANPNDKTLGLGSLLNDYDAEKYLRQQEKAREDENEKVFRDLKDEASLETLFSSINNGTYDILVDQMKQVQTLTDEELRQAFPEHFNDQSTEEDYEKFREESREIVERGNYIKNLDQKLRKRFKNPFDPDSNEIDTNFGYSENILYNAYERARYHVLKNHYTYKRRVERKADMMNAVGKRQPFWRKDKTPMASDVNVILEQADLKKEISLLKQEISTMKQSESLDKEGKKSLKSKEKKVAQLEKLLESIGLFTGGMSTLDQEIAAMKPVNGSKVILKTTGGEGVIIGETAKKYKVRKESGRVAYYNKNNVALSEDSKVEEKAKKELKNLEKLKKEYDAYMQYLAAENDNTVDLEELNDSFKIFADYHLISEEEKAIDKSINILADPQAFEELLFREATLRYNTWKNKKEQIANSIEAARKAEEMDALIKILANEHNAFISEEDVIALMDGEGFPDEIYDIDTAMPIDSDSERFMKVVLEIQQYLNGKFERVKEGSKTYLQYDLIKPEMVKEGPTELAKDFIEGMVAEKPAYINKIIEVNEDGTTEVEIRVNGKTHTVTLVKPEKFETTEEKAKPTVTKKEKVTIKDPYGTWPEELQTKVQEHVDNENKKAEEAGLEADISVEDYVNNPQNSGTLQQIIDDYYGLEEKATGEATEEATEEVDVESIKQSMKDVKKHQTSNQEPVEVKLDLEDAVVSKILAGEMQAMTMSLTGDNINAIKEAVAKKYPKVKLEDFGGEESEVPGMTFELEVEIPSGQKFRISLVYAGKKTAREMRDSLEQETNGALALSMGLDTKPSPGFETEVTISDPAQTFFAASKEQGQWLNDTGKMNVFMIGVEEIDTTKEEAAAGEEMIKAFISDYKAALTNVKDETDAREKMGPFQLRLKILNEKKGLFPLHETGNKITMDSIKSGFLAAGRKGGEKAPSTADIKFNSINLATKYLIQTEGGQVEAIAVDKKGDKVIFEGEMGDMHEINKSDLESRVGEEVTEVAKKEFSEDVIETVKGNDTTQEEITDSEVDEKLAEDEGKSAGDLFSRLANKAKDNQDKNCE